MKTKQDNDITNHIGAIQVENGMKFSWLVQPGVVYDENQME